MDKVGEEGFGVDGSGFSDQAVSSLRVGFEEGGGCERPKRTLTWFKTPLTGQSSSSSSSTSISMSFTRIKLRFFGGRMGTSNARGRIFVAGSGVTRCGLLCKAGMLARRSSSVCLGLRRSKGGSGEHDEALEGGLLSREAFVREGVGGSSCSMGDGVREGGFEG